MFKKKIEPWKILFSTRKFEHHWASWMVWCCIIKFLCRSVMRYFNQTDAAALADYCLWFGFTFIKFFTISDSSSPTKRGYYLVWLTRHQSLEMDQLNVINGIFHLQIHRWWLGSVQRDVWWRPSHSQVWLQDFLGILENHRNDRRQQMSRHQTGWWLWAMLHGAVLIRIWRLRRLLPLWQPRPPQQRPNKGASRSSGQVLLMARRRLHVVLGLVLGRRRRAYHQLRTRRHRQSSLAVFVLAGNKARESHPNLQRHSMSAPLELLGLFAMH